jgi:hypothetical protein
LPCKKRKKKKKGRFPPTAERFKGKKEVKGENELYSNRKSGPPKGRKRRKNQLLHIQGQREPTKVAQ